MKWVVEELPLHSTIKDCGLRVVGYRFCLQLHHISSNQLTLHYSTTKRKQLTFFINETQNTSISSLSWAGAITFFLLQSSWVKWKKKKDQPAGKHSLIKGREVKAINHHSLQWMIGVDLLSALLFPERNQSNQMKIFHWFVEGEKAAQQSTNQPLFFSRSGRKKSWFVVAVLAALAAWFAIPSTQPLSIDCFISLAAPIPLLNQFKEWIGWFHSLSLAAHPSISFISFNQFTFWFVNWWRNERLWAHYTATDLRQQIKNYSTIS